METITMDTKTERQPRAQPALGARLRRDVGALTTELAILVAVLVAIAIGLAAIMRTSATAHQSCIPQTPGAAVPAGC